MLVCLNKCDLDPAEGLYGIYSCSAIPVLRISAETGEGLDALRRAIAGKLNAFTGNSGVGKSSVLNALVPGLQLPVGEVSKALGRGRHTTRHVELFPLGGGTYVIDTPGFSSFDTEEMDLELKEHLPETFPEFAPYVGECRFTGCTHTKEKGCRVLQAVKDGDSYRLIFGYTEDVARFNYGFVHGSKTKIGNLIVGWNQSSNTIVVVPTVPDLSAAGEAVYYRRSEILKAYRNKYPTDAFIICPDRKAYIGINAYDWLGDENVAQEEELAAFTEFFMKSFATK